MITNSKTSQGQGRLRRSAIALILAITTLGGAGVFAAAINSDTEPAIVEVQEAQITKSFATTIGADPRRVTILVNGGAEPQAFYGVLRNGISHASIRDFAAAAGAEAIIEGDGAVTVDRRLI